jgi:F0F1-type ATP synthase membrane subunit c/vacuolar-type H+-ATPase subunit K
MAGVLPDEARELDANALACSLHCSPTMSGEAQISRELVRRATEAAAQDPTHDKDGMGRALISAVLAEYATYRAISDIAAELQYLSDNLGEDTFVITRGC